MLKLTFPRETENVYLYYVDMLFGPFGSNLLFEGEEISLPSNDDTFSERRGMYGENHVEHTKYSASVSYHPAVANVSYIPNASYPDRIEAPWGATPGKLTVLRGFATPGSVKMRSVNYYHTQAAIMLGQAANTYVIVFLHSPMATPTRISGLARYELRPLSKNNYYLWNCHQTASTYTLPGSGAGTNYDWSKRQSYETVINTFTNLSQLVSPVTLQTPNLTVPYNTVRMTEIVSPSEILRVIQRYARGLLGAENVPKPMDFGDLAMKASEKVNATGINTIAFLRDLRDPSSLVPKLRNLRNLKGWSSNYLTVKYGILPTISDLQSIMDALKKIKPYYDKNGFTTYTASHNANANGEGYVTSLEQHIKLAVGDEDNAFESLLEGVEKIGMLPSLENVWDLLPYTFVIDWFLNVGEFLARVDTRLRLSRFNIRYVTMSLKESATMTLSENPKDPFSGTISWVHYHRWVSDQCPVPPLSLQPAQSFNHWLEGGALIMQRTR